MEGISGISSLEWPLTMACHGLPWLTFDFQLLPQTGHNYYHLCDHNYYHIRSKWFIPVYPVQAMVTFSPLIWVHRHRCVAKCRKVSLLAGAGCGGTCPDAADVIQSGQVTNFSLGGHHLVKWWLKDTSTTMAYVVNVHGYCKQLVYTNGCWIIWRKWYYAYICTYPYTYLCIEVDIYIYM